MENKDVIIFNLGLSEISKGLVTNYMTIFATNRTRITNIDEFLEKMHQNDIRTNIFTDVHKYLLYIEQNYMDSIATTSLIFAKPDFFIKEVGNADRAWEKSK